jgi:hypothetical protein
MFSGAIRLVKKARNAPMPGQNNKNEMVNISPKKKIPLAISHIAHIGNIKIPPFMLAKLFTHLTILYYNFT